MRYLCNTINHTYKYNNLKLKINMETGEYSYRNEVVTLTNDIELAKSMPVKEVSIEDIRAVKLNLPLFPSF